MNYLVGLNESSQKRDTGGLKLEEGHVRMETKIKDRNVSKDCRQLPGRPDCSVVGELSIHQKVVCSLPSQGTYLEGEIISWGED